MDEDDIYRWRGDDEQKRLYPYVTTYADIDAFNAYCRPGKLGLRFLPPQRPGGFLDEHEEACWTRWKAAAEARVGEEP